MSKLRVLDFQYSMSKRLQIKPVTWLTSKDRQLSDLITFFRPRTEEMRQVFEKLDSNEDGKVSSDDLKSLLISLGKESVTAEVEVKSMMQVADLNKDGVMDFNEFMEVHKRGVRLMEIQHAFWMFDENGDGRISAEEVRSMLRKLGEQWSLEECRRMVKQVDKSGTGLVDMDDFISMMTSTMKLM